MVIANHIMEHLVTPAPTPTQDLEKSMLRSSMSSEIPSESKFKFKVATEHINVMFINDLDGRNTPIGQLQLSNLTMGLVGVFFSLCFFSEYYHV